jgi:hypothetical protein
MIEFSRFRDAMEITLTIPHELARQIIAEGLDASRQALEDIGVEAYHAHRVTGAQLRRLLGIPSRYELDAFLKRRGVWLEYTRGISGAKERSRLPCLTRQGVQDEQRRGNPDDRRE